jgi:hypothetical protein
LKISYNKTPKFTPPPPLEHFQLVLFYVSWQQANERVKKEEKYRVRRKTSSIKKSQ